MKKRKPEVEVLPSRGELISQLRTGGKLTADGIGAVADEINAQFEKLKLAWGGKQYFTGASVKLFDDMSEQDPDNYYTTSLSFRKHDRGWAFAIEEEHCRDCDGESLTSSPLSSAPLEVRIMAVRALPQLEQALKDARDRQRMHLIGAFDDLAAYVNSTLTAEQDEGNGDG